MLYSTYQQNTRSIPDMNHYSGLQINQLILSNDGLICSKVSEKYAVTILTVTAFGSRTLKEILYSTQCENPEDHPFGHLIQKP